MTGKVPERGLILAPTGRDATVARGMLSESAVRADVVADVPSLVAELEMGAGFGIITEEALSDLDLHGLSRWIEDQPEWSDFPFVLLTRRGGGLERNPEASRFLDLLGNVTFLERPFHPTTFVSLAQSALRGRRRQYEARARLAELNQLAADLERRVEERTAEHAVAVAQLHEAQKLETLGQLTGGVAHDFNNLLTPITGALDLLYRRFGNSDARTARLLSNALQAADRAKTLLQRLLGFARRQSLQTQAVDISALLSGMRDLIASSVGPTIDVRLRCDAAIQPALVDPNQLELAILNLAVNARDAMPDGGLLTILAEEIAVGPRSKPKLTPGLYVRLSVIDAGCGMDANTLTHAIEPFYSTKEFGRGTGLGLSMVHGLAAQLGGGFDLTSALGEADSGRSLSAGGRRSRDRPAAIEPKEPVVAVGRRLERASGRRRRNRSCRDGGDGSRSWSPRGGSARRSRSARAARRGTGSRRVDFGLHDAGDGRRSSGGNGIEVPPRRADLADHRLYRADGRRASLATPGQAVRSGCNRRSVVEPVRRRSQGCADSAAQVGQACLTEGFSSGSSDAD